jgi:hypothetical protein
MIILISAIVIIIISFIMAVRSADHELSVPKEVSKIQIKKKNNMNGVILFLKEKIIHYSSDSSS